jgi:hypothetical protein
MPNVKLPDVDITFDSLIYTLALIVAVAGVLVALVKGWEALNKISVRGRVKGLEDRMSKVEERLRQGDKRFDLQSNDMGQVLQTMQSLLIHFISGNDHDRLRGQLTDLTNYISKRATQAQQHEQEGQ